MERATLPGKVALPEATKPGTGAPGLSKPSAKLEVIFQMADHSESQIRAKEGQLETIINRTPFMLTRCTRDLRYRFVSKAYAEMLRREPHEIEGKPIVDIIGEPALNTIMPYVERVLAGELVEYESEVPFESVGPRAIRVVYTPDCDERGAVIGWIASIADNSDRKRAAAESERALKTEHELREVAEEANRLKDEFLAIMSHELRNPLNVILGYSDLLVRSSQLAQFPQLLRMADAVRRNAKAQAKLVADLLDLSRLRSGKLELKSEIVPIIVCVNNAIDTVRADAETKQIHVAFDQADESLFVEGDPVRLQQIVWNLLNNSIKFSPNGSRISVRLGKDCEQIVLTVSDTGHGIDRSFLPHVFELFRQGDASTARSQSGMGIGLAVVRQLVELHGGSISAYSAGSGQGATFTVKLPLSLEMKAEATPVPEISVALNKLSVLVVDDSEDTAEMLATLLKASGAKVSAATSGNEALRIIAEREFDIVLSDISMPGMDGFEFLRNLRQLPDGAEVPVLALTGFGRPEDIERAKSEGFLAHVTKPFDTDALIEVLRQIPVRRH